MVNETRYASAAVQVDNERVAIDADSKMQMLAIAYPQVGMRATLRNATGE